MRCRSSMALCVTFGVFALVGCDEGPKIPPSKGAQSRDEIEQPFGPPKNLKKKKGAAKADDAETKPRVVH
ncbi:hypothetical protein ACYOEI_20640 [Singulisphaera rosea]